MQYFRVSCLIGAFLLVTMPCIFAQSQLGSGAIRGVVTDATDAVIPGATVTAINVDTGVERTIITNNSGGFHMPVVPLGRYMVRVELSGFATLEQRNLMVNVGSTVTLRLQLQVADVAQVVTVESAPLLDTSKTEESVLVAREQIDQLPLNGRRSDQFVLLAPGVSRDGRFGNLSYRGQSGSFNNYMIEGNDDNQAYYAEPRGRTRIASNISAAAIQEFQVATGGFLAEFGRASGGGINAVVRSGGNDFHGEAFYFFQNQSLVARDPLAAREPDSERQQFGGTLGGPLKKNKAFFFFSYDQELRDYPLITEDLSGVLTRGLPSNPSAEDLVAFEAGTTFLRGRFPDGAPGNALPRTRNQNLVLGKVDWLISEMHSFTATYNHLNARGRPGIQSALVLGNVGRNGSDDVRIHSLHSRLTSTLSPRAINEFRFQFTRDFNYQIANEPPPQVYVGSFSFGKANFLNRQAEPDERRLQFVNNFSFSVGNHDLKFGVDVNRVRDRLEGDRDFEGTFRYSNALTFGRDLLDPMGRNYTSFSQNFGRKLIQFTTYDFAFFAQDKWKLGNVTINYGLRWDYQQIPNPEFPHPDWPQTNEINRDLNNFGPRLGLAWDLAGQGKTVFRAGYGIFYGRTPNGGIQERLRFTGLPDPSKSTVSLRVGPNDPGAPIYPNILPGIPAEARGGTSLEIFDPDFQRPQIQDFNIGIEQQLNQNLVISASFVYTKGSNIPLSLDGNLPEPNFTRTYQLPDGSTFSVPYVAGVIRTADGVSRSINLSRPNPNFGSVDLVSSIGENWYKGFLVELRRRFANNFQLNASYTLAKAQNLAGSGGGGGHADESPFNGGRPANQFNLNDRGISSTDQRHRFVLNGILELPWDFRVSGIYTAETGRPYAAVISIPSVPFTENGIVYNGFGGVRGQGGGSDRNQAPNILRNSAHGDNNFRLDLRLSRNFNISEGMQIEFLVEGFNLFNRSNYNGNRTTRYEASRTTTSTPLSEPIQLTDRGDWGRVNDNRTPPDGSGARRFNLSVRFRF